MSTVEHSRAAFQAESLWKLLDSERTLALVDKDDWEQLRRALLSVPQQAGTPNTIVNLDSPQGDTLSIGIAGSGDEDNPGLAEPLACLNFTPASRNPPYLTVVGDPSLSFANGGVIVFRFEEGTWTEILRRNCVPVDTMLEVAKHFFLTGTLPQWIAWEEV